MDGKFVHIRYFPVRDPHGTYLSTMEAVQDVTPIRALTGHTGSIRPTGRATSIR